MKPKPNPAYLDFVRSKPCMICGKDSVAHHVRLKGLAGVGMKPPDEYAIPLCWECHGCLHGVGQRTFFKRFAKVKPEDYPAWILNQILKLNKEYKSR